MTVEPFTHLRPGDGNHANLHNLNAVPRRPGCGACVPAPAAGLQLLGRCRAGSGIPVLLPRGVGRAGVLARMLQVSGASWFRWGMQVVVLPALGPAGAQREVPAGVGF